MRTLMNQARSTMGAIDRRHVFSVLAVLAFMALALGSAAGH